MRKHVHKVDYTESLNVTRKNRLIYKNWARSEFDFPDILAIPQNPGPYKVPLVSEGPFGDYQGSFLNLISSITVMESCPATGNDA